MKRLNDDELNARIKGFLQRKLEEFPDLAENGRMTEVGSTGHQPKSRYSHPNINWGDQATII